jgi:hypothetical protein
MCGGVELMFALLSCAAPCEVWASRSLTKDKKPLCQSSAQLLWSVDLSCWCIHLVASVAGQRQQRQHHNSSSNSSKVEQP